MGDDMRGSLADAVHCRMKFSGYKDASSLLGCRMLLGSPYASAWYGADVLAGPKSALGGAVGCGILLGVFEGMSTFSIIPLSM